MDIAELANVLERAWRQALPGREAVERDAVLRELWRKQESKAPVRFVRRHNANLRERVSG